MEFTEFFRAATGYAPFPYQEKIAQLEAPYLFLNVPTGAGKTAAAMLSWLWRRRCCPVKEVRENTPRRLVYCLPMRTLAEQVKDNITKMIENLTRHACSGIDTAVHLLMGGEADDDWMLHPEKEQVLVGTQEMLLSRALNRGYALSRFRWPWAFGLLHHDCLWVFDEVQLMGSGLVTTAQLAAFNRLFGTFLPCHYLWLSATLEKSWFNTVDFAPFHDQATILALGEEDRGHRHLQKRLVAGKSMEELPLQGKNENQRLAYLAGQVASLREEKKLTLVVVNRVERAQKIYEHLRKHKKKQGAAFDILLIHARFRHPERAALNRRLASLKETDDCIVVSTQAVEAGIDISAASLFTEIAPWPSVVQRLGRCNRYGNLSKGRAYWVEVTEQETAPYSQEEIDWARNILRGLEGKNVAPGCLPEYEMDFGFKPVLRKKDLLELFDTTPDLSGADIDVSRFIRHADAAEVQFYWRRWANEGRPPAELAEPFRDELLSVDLGRARKFLNKLEEKKIYAYHWDYLEGRWQRLAADRLRPGITVLLPAEAGGYSSELGWTGNLNLEVKPVASPATRRPEEDTTGDLLTFRANNWETLAEHSDRVVEEMQQLLKEIGKESKLDKAADILILAARFHDLGKTHEVFQETMCRAQEAPPAEGKIWAKSPAKYARHRQPYFRHELAGALALLQNRVCPGLPDEESLNLLAYLVAAHHGKIRLSIRSLPGEKPPASVPGDTRISRGIWEGSRMQKADLGGGITIPDISLTLEPMELGLEKDGTPSWLERTVALKDRWGPFKLAFMEALVRAADVQASLL